MISETNHTFFFAKRPTKIHLHGIHCYSLCAKSMTFGFSVCNLFCWPSSLLIFNGNGLRTTIFFLLRKGFTNHYFLIGFDHHPKMVGVPTSTGKKIIVTAFLRLIEVFEPQRGPICWFSKRRPMVCWVFWTKTHNAKRNKKTGETWEEISGNHVFFFPM